MEYDNTWRKEFKEMKGPLLTERQVQLLDNGPDSLSSSWALMAMKNEWNRIKGHKEKESPDCQSSFNDFSKKNQ